MQANPLCDAGQGSKLRPLPGQPPTTADTPTAIPHPCGHSVFHFEYSIQYVMWAIQSYSAPFCQIGFMLDDFVLL